MQLKKETTVGIFILISISSFLFMSYKIGFFSFDKMSYVEYSAHLKTAMGLIRKADVKIAGVKIGWLDSFDIAKNGTYVDAKLMLLKKYKLYSDAEIIIRQDGPLGAKFIEINPGHSDKSVLPHGGIISDLESSQPSLDDIFSSVADIAKTLNEFLNTVKHNSPENADQMKMLVNNCSNTVSRLSLVSQNLEEYFLKSDFSDTLKHINSKVPKVLENAEQMISNINSASESVKVIADKINNATKKIAGDQNFFPQTTTEHESLFLNNLISRTDKFLYCLDQISSVTIGLDNNYEFLINQNSNTNFKSLFNLWLHPWNNYFFIGGVNFSKLGFVKRSIKVEKDEQNCVKLVNTSKIKRNSFGLNLQAGSYFRNFILRIGLFESTPGLALDCLLPIPSNKIKWISTFEAFDFTGKNKIDGFRYNPHLKWMNRLYFSPNFYLSFGADDFANKEKRFGFLGVGLNFGSVYFKNLFC